jgi:hypothetical protein
MRGREMDSYEYCVASMSGSAAMSSKISMITDSSPAQRKVSSLAFSLCVIVVSSMRCYESA